MTLTSQLCLESDIKEGEIENLRMKTNWMHADILALGRESDVNMRVMVECFVEVSKAKKRHKGE